MDVILTEAQRQHGAAHVFVQVHEAAHPHDDAHSSVGDVQEGERARQYSAPHLYICVCTYSYEGQEGEDASESVGHLAACRPPAGEWLRLGVSPREGCRLATARPARRLSRRAHCTSDRQAARRLRTDMYEIDRLGAPLRAGQRGMPATERCLWYCWLAQAATDESYQVWQAGRGVENIHEVESCAQVGLR